MNHQAQPEEERDPEEETIATPGARSIGPDERTLGGIPSAEARRAKRESGHPAEHATPSRQRTTRELPVVADPEAPGEHPTEPGLAMPEMPRVDRGTPAPDLPPPDHATAIDLARRFLAGSTSQADVGRDGAEAMARWVRDHALDLQIIAIGRSCREGSAAEALIREQCRIALGIVGDLVSYERIEQARQWCREYLEREAARKRAMAEARQPARIYTPANDGSCMVCGEMVAAHNVDIDDGCRVGGVRPCPAVAP